MDIRKKRESRNILLISISRLVSEMGAIALRFALSLYILDTTGSPLVSGFVFAFTYIPGILVNTFAGVFIDRSDKKKVLVASDMLSGVATLLFMAVFMFWMTDIAAIVAYILILYTLQGIFMLALNAAIPEMVSSERVINVNSNIQGISALVNILGTFLGATVYLTLGFGVIFLLGGITFLLSGMLNMMFVFVNKPERNKEDRKPYKESFKEVYRFIRERKEIKHLLGVFVVGNFIIAPMLTVVLIYVIRDRLRMVDYEMAFIEAALGVGFIIGALLVSMKRIGSLATKNIFVLVQLTALTLLAWVFPALNMPGLESKTTIVVVYTVILMLTGIFNVMANIPMVSYVQIYVPENIRASIFGIVTTVTTASVPVGLILYGGLLEVVNWVVIVIVSGGMLLLVGYLAHRNKGLREFFNQKQDVAEEGQIKGGERSVVLDQQG